MSTLPYIVKKIRRNAEVQTYASVATPELFDFQSDDLQVEKQRPAHFEYKPDAVEKLVSAVQGDDEEVRAKYRVLNVRTRRFRQLVQSLRNQIDRSSRNKGEKEQNEIYERLIREMARAVDPASRHCRNQPVFNHQKYENPIKLGLGKLTKSGQAPLDFNAIYSFNEELVLENNDTVLYFEPISADTFVANKPIKVLYKNEPYGNLTLADADFKVRNNPTITKLDRVNDDTKTLFLFRGFGSNNDSINLKTLINPYDFSFVDIVLSLPRLNQEEATNLLIYLYRSGYLSAFIRAKICQFIYERKTPRIWPELLGRFISLLDKKWFEDVGKIMERCELPNAVKALSKMNQCAMFVMNIVIDEFTGMNRGDIVEFVWELLCKSMFMNNYLGIDEINVSKRRQFDSLYQQTLDKPPESKTRALTANIVEAIQQRSNYKVPSKRFSPSEFLQNLITGHPYEIVIALKNIPRKGPEASPLFYPLALEIKEALESYNEFENFDSQPDESGIVSNVDYRGSESSSASRRSSRRGGDSDIQYSSASRSSRSGNRKREIEVLSENSATDDDQLSASSSSHASRSSRASRSSHASRHSQSSHASRQTKSSYATSSKQSANSRHSQASRHSGNTRSSRNTQSSHQSKHSSPTHSSKNNTRRSHGLDTRDDDYDEEIIYEEEEDFYEEEEDVPSPPRSRRHK